MVGTVTSRCWGNSQELVEECSTNQAKDSVQECSLDVFDKKELGKVADGCFCVWQSRKGTKSCDTAKEKDPSTRERITQGEAPRTSREGTTQPKYEGEHE